MQTEFDLDNIPPLAELLPEDSPGFETIREKGYKTVADVVKAYGELNGQFHRTTRAPLPTATPEERRAFFRKIGAPDAPEGYALPKDIDAGVGGFLEGLRAALHEEGVTAKQWESLVRRVTEIHSARDDEAKSQARAQQESWEKEIKKALGDQHDELRGHAERVWKQFEEHAPKFAEAIGSLRGHPEFVQHLVEVSKLVSQHRTPGSTPKTTNPADNLKEARELAARIRELHLSPDIKQHSPKHAQVMREVMEKTARLNRLGFKGATDPRIDSDIRI